MGFNGDLYPTAGASVVMTTKGDMVDYDTERQRLGIGSTGQVLTVASSLPTWATLTTADSVLTTQGDVLYESASGLARLGFGTSGDVLTTKGTGANPVWETPSGGTTLTKVTKSYTDISSGEMAIYTLPQDQALVNVFTDITTVFDESTAVTIGDAADNDGFQQTGDWTSGTGLTDVTRGAYVTTFKTMRSTSGTTAITGYNFGSSSLFEQNLEGTARGFNNGGGRVELAQQFNAGHVLAGSTIKNVTWKIKDSGGSPTGTLSCYIREADGTQVAVSPDTVNMTTLTGSYQTFNFSFPNTTLDATEMLTIAGVFTNSGTTDLRSQATEMTNGKLYATSSIGSSYSQLVGEEMTMTVTYNLVDDTQGAVDFYLQIAS